MEHDTDSLTEHFSPRDIQALQDAIARDVKLPIAIVAAEGLPLTKPDNQGFFCKLETAELACAGCWYHLPRPRPHDLLFGACPRTGLSIVGVPIMLGNVCMGGWVLGQLRLTQPAGKTLKNIAKTNAIRLEEAISGMEAIPRVGWEELGRIIDFMSRLHRLLPQLTQSKDRFGKGVVRLREMVATLHEEGILRKK